MPASVRFFILFAIIAALSASPLISTAPANAGVLYVDAAHGSDGNSGTKSKPFKTIQRAADAAMPGDTVFIRSGAYRETVIPRYSGQAGSPITFASFPGETPVITGCEPVIAKWSPAGGKIYEAAIQLPITGYADHIKDDYSLMANQIFVGDKMMIEARWPNISNPEDLLNRKDWRWHSDFSNVSGQTIKLNDPLLPNPPGGLSGATIFFGGWFMQRTGTVTNSSDGTLSFSVPTGISTQIQPVSSGKADDWSSFNRYYFLTGKLCFLDAPYEWYYDGASLSLWAPNSLSPKHVEYKKRNFAFDLSGRSYITIKGVHLFAATITTDKDSRGIVIDGIEAKYNSHYVTFSGNDFDVLECHYADSGIRLMAPDSIIENSRIIYSAGHGIVLGAPGDTASNNFVSDIDYAGSYECGIEPVAHPVNILHNTITRTGRSSIADFSSDHIAYNDLSYYGLLNSDLGAIYTANNVDCSGGEIDHNLIHDASSWWGNHGIYTDNSSGNALIHHNVIWNVADLAIVRNQGEMPNRIYNNTVCSGTMGLLVDNKVDDIRNNIFTTWNGDFGGNPPKTDLKNASHNLYSDTDPQFVDAAHYDFRLKAQSPAIAAGVAIPPYTDGFTGPAPDIGALAYGQPPLVAGASLKAVR